MFGGKSAPYIFNLFVEALHWIIQKHIPARLRHYLDDFLPIFEPSTGPPIANAVIDWIKKTATALGLSFQPKKTVRPTTRLEFLDWNSTQKQWKPDSHGQTRLPSRNIDQLGSTQPMRPQRIARNNRLPAILRPSGTTRPHIYQRANKFLDEIPSEFALRHIPAYARADYDGGRHMCSMEWHPILDQSKPLCMYIPTLAA